MVGSTKSNMGHPEPASGLAALAKVTGALKENWGRGGTQSVWGLFLFYVCLFQCKFAILSYLLLTSPANTCKSSGGYSARWTQVP